jgi:kinesin family protein 2/24
LGAKIYLRETSSKGLVIDGASSIRVGDVGRLKILIQTAHERRSTESTGANSVSSRSHAVCIIQFPKSGGKLVLVDLAGSERRKDSMWHDKDRQKEGAEINASLHALKECIRWKRNLGRSSSGPPAPFRLSVLTRLLSESFTNPTSRLAVIATVSPCATDIEHTITTLKTVMGLSSCPQAIIETKQTDLAGACKALIESRRPIRSSDPPRPTYVDVPPKKWTCEQVSEWCVGFPKGTTGAMLIRMPESRFIQICQGDEKRGVKLFRDLHDYISKHQKA